MTLTHNGRRFTVTTEHDPDTGAPWLECDGHGIVSDWTTRAKRPGERILTSDGDRAFRYYDVEASTVIARRDDWGCGESAHTHATDGERVACAVDRDFEYLRGWCADEWGYCCVTVTLLDAAPTRPCQHHGAPSLCAPMASLCGVEDRDDAYVLTVARELADEILATVPA